MNVAVLEIERSSLIAADIINRFYNPWIEKRLGEPLNVIAFVTNVWGGGEYPAAD